MAVGDVGQDRNHARLAQDSCRWRVAEFAGLAEAEKARLRAPACFTSGEIREIPALRAGCLRVLCGWTPSTYADYQMMFLT